MNHTPQIKKAIQFAARKHHGQMRVADGNLPYITHPFSVALLVAEDGAHDDVVTAALLHDTIEDTSTTREEILREFNECVALLVEAVSEVRVKDGKKLSWQERKAGYLEHLRHAPDDALIISIADKIDNTESRLEEYTRGSEEFLKHFSQPIEEYLRFHGAVLALGQERLPGHPLVKRLAEVHATELATLSR